MKARTPLTSRSPQRAVQRPEAPRDAATPAAAATAPAPRRQALAAWLHRRERWLWALGALLLALAAGGPAWMQRQPGPLNLKALDAALRESLIKEPLPSPAAAAHAAVLPSVVRVMGHAAAPGDKAAARAARRPPAVPADDGANPAGGASVGTGVVIVDRGLVLTALHVVEGAARISVTFADGSESDAVVVNRQPENDLAVLQVTVLPDDLHAATLRSTQGLAPGDEVLAVGFPFGIGPSASAGVVSGLQREFRAPDGGPVLRNLIQFDAAANPGNSGGPLVTMDGHVVGIVTAIMNPNRQRTFIGIGFAVPIENAAAAAGMPPF